MLVLDTHVFYWVAAGHRSLGARARRAIDRALPSVGVALSAFTFWELASLLERGRLRSVRTASELRAAALSKGIRELPVDGPIAIAAAQLRSLHGDPADRIILATALEHGATLVTADAVLLEHPGGVTIMDATR